MASISVTMVLVPMQYMPGSAPIEMSIWVAPPSALAEACTEGTSFSSPTGVMNLRPLEVTGPMMRGTVPAVEAGSDDADIAVHIDGIGALDHHRLGVEISQRLDQRLVGFFALVKHVRKALAAVGIGDAEQPIGADADSAASGLDAVAPQQLLRDESVGGAAGQQQIGGFPSLLKLGHGDDCLGNQGAGTRRMSG